MKSMITINNKLCAIFLTLCLTFPQAFALAEEKDALVDIGNMAIPESLGKIDERFQGTSKRWVINIQDVHAHFGAQENIAAIIDHLNEVYGLRLVAYEGGWNVTSYPKTWEIQSSRQKQLVLRTLMEEDLITGPAFAAMNSKTPIVLHGVENADIYKQNLRVYLKFIERKDSVEKSVAAFQESLSHKKTELYNPDLLNFDRSLLKFREDSKAAEKFLPQLLTLSKTLAIDLTDLPQMQLFIQVSDIEKSIDKTKLKAEIDRIMLEHKNSRLSFEEMLRHGTLTDEKLSFYPNAEKQRSLLKLHDGIVSNQLFTEIEKTILMVKEKLFKTDTEKELDQEFDRFMTAKKLMIFKATPADLKLYRKFKTLIRKEMKAAQLASHLKRGYAFYTLAEKRDQVFFKEITTSPELTAEDIALVAGGFHTEGMRELLRNAGISYMVITPQLGQESVNEDLYLKRLQGLRVLAQTLSEMGNSLSDQQDSRIAEALRQYASGVGDGKFRDIRNIVSFVAGADQPAQKESTQSFLALTKDEQRKAVEKAIASILSGVTPVSVVVRANALTGMLANSPLTEALLKAIMENPANHITVLYKSFMEVPDIISDAFGNKNVRTVGEADIHRAILNLPPAQKRNKLAVISNDYKNKEALVLQESPLALLLFRALLESGWEFAWGDEKTQSVIANLAEDILKEKGFAASA